jgi:4'-phosphopantetheinyl transferase
MRPDLLATPTWHEGPFEADRAAMAAADRLGTAQVHVLQCSLAEPSAAASVSSLSTDEAVRAGRFHRPQDRELFVRGRAWLRGVLGNYLGVPPQDVRFVIGEHGKPALAAPHAWLQFNLSHTGSLALLALTRVGAVGIDVEAIRAMSDMAAIARRQFAPSERLRWSQLPPDQQPSAFYACWTRKEAFVKALGAGLSLPLDGFEVAFEPARPAALLSIDGSPQRAAGWSMWAFEPLPGFCAAVVARGSGLELRRIDPA